MAGWNFPSACKKGEPSVDHHKLSTCLQPWDRKTGLEKKMVKGANFPWFWEIWGIIFMAAGKEWIVAAVFMASERKVETKIFLQSQSSQEMGQWNGCCSVEDILSSPYLLFWIRKDSWIRGDASRDDNCFWANIPSRMWQDACCDVCFFLWTLISWRLVNLGEMEASWQFWMNLCSYILFLEELESSCFFPQTWVPSELGPVFGNLLPIDRGPRWWLSCVICLLSRLRLADPGTCPALVSEPSHPCWHEVRTLCVSQLSTTLLKWPFLFVTLLAILRQRRLQN